MDKEQLNFKAVIEYDGSGYHGFQKQKEARTVQGVLEGSLKTLTKNKVVVCGAGRTDAGVHATGQVISFQMPASFKPANILRALNSLLPGDIVVRSVEYAEPDFHARFSARSKLYTYLIYQGTDRSAFLRTKALLLKKRIDLEMAEKILDRFRGNHEFRHFARLDGTEKKTRLTIDEIFLKCIGAKKNLLLIDFRARKFLRNMIRRIIGTMLMVLQGKTRLDEVEKALRGEEVPGLIKYNAPPDGLYLRKVFY